MKLVWIAVLTTLTFVVLQLTHVIHWSWWFVFLPLIIEGGILVVAYVLIFFSIIVAALVSKRVKQ